MCHASDVLQGKLEGEVEHSEVVEDGRAISRTDVLLATEGGDGNGVCPEGAGLHAREAAIDVPLQRQTDMQSERTWRLRSPREIVGGVEQGPLLCPQRPQDS